MDELEDSPNRDQRITLRVTEAERAAIADAAEAANRSMSEHIRQTAADANTARPRVPPINREAWEELARLAANLNQIAKRANELRARFANHEPTDDWASRAVSQLFSVLDFTDEMTARIHSVRRSLYAAAPLKLAADTLADYQRAANAGQIDVAPDRIASILEALCDLADDLEEAS